MRISDWSSDVCSSDLVGESMNGASRDCSRRSAGPTLRSRRPRQKMKLGGDQDRKSVVSGKSVSVRVDLGGRRIIQKKRRRLSSATRSAKEHVTRAKVEQCKYNR